MSTEEKAKAYDEAMNKIKPLYEQAKRDGNPVWSTYEHLFPQLRESEDERIRKALLEYFNERNSYRDEDETFNGVPFSSIIAYLEKQKDAFENGRQLGIMQEQARQELERTDEEQKPISFNESYNPDEYEVVMEGNATSLKRKDQKPVDYEHEMWKNCEANFEGGKKEVIEHPEKYGLQKGQKPNYCHYGGDPNSERYRWCSAACSTRLTEEQKPAQTEQLHSGLICTEVLNKARENKYVRGQLLWELMHNGIISEADHIYLMDDDRKPWTTNEHQKSYKEGFNAAEELQKLKQKPAENNVIIPQFRIGDYIKPKAYNEEHLIKDINKDGYVLDVDFVVPFKDEDVWEVVKQKSTEIDFEDWDMLGYIRDIVRKHVIRDEEFNVLDKWLTEHYVNQKPAEINEYEIIKKHITEDSLSSEVNKRLKECGWYVTDEKPAEKQDCSGLTDLERVIHRGFLSAGIENVPVTIIKETANECLAQMKPAWSEKDKEKIDHLSFLLTLAESNGFITASKRIELGDFLIKSLRPQPKQEWSKEDENKIERLAFLISVAAEKEMISEEECIDLRNFIKSLRPQPQNRNTYYDIIHNILGSLKGIDFTQITPEHRVSLLNDIRVKCKNADECAAILDEPHWKPSEQKYDGNMDKECIKLCDVLNFIPSINTFESCCGHLNDRYSIWFFCNDIITISRLGRCVERNYSDGKWELLVDSTDTHPTGVFWLRSKVPFQSYDKMEKSVNELCNNIQYWFNTKFDSYFNGNSC